MDKDCEWRDCEKEAFRHFMFHHFCNKHNKEVRNLAKEEKPNDLVEWLEEKINEEPKTNS